MALEWLLMGGAAAALATAVAGLARGAVNRSNPHQDYVESVWQDVADALDGTLTVHPQPALTPRRLRLDVEVDGVAVVLETRVPMDPGVLGTTSAVAGYALGEGPRFQMTPRRPNEAPGESAALGDPALSQRFQLRTEDPDAVAVVFDEPAKEALREFQHGLVGADGRKVRLEWDGAERRGAVLTDASRLAARIALVGMQTLRTLTALEGAKLTHTESGPVVALTRLHVTVLLQGTATRRGPAFDARAESARELPELDLRIADGGLEGDVPAGLVDGDMAELLHGTGDARLTLRPDRVKLEFDEPPTRAQAEAGASLVARIAAGSVSGGAFR